MGISKEAEARLALIEEIEKSFGIFKDEEKFLAYVDMVTRERAEAEARGEEPYSFPYLEDRTRFNTQKEYTRAGNVLYRMLPVNGQVTSDIVILYFHGGGWVGEMNEATWLFCQQFCDRLGCQVISTDYPLAPKYSYKEAFAYVLDVYGELLETVDPSKVVFSGDSAGGYMSLAAAQLALQNGLPQPATIIPLSPSFDMTQAPVQRTELEKIDPMLGTAGFRLIPKIWAPDIEDFAAFPPSPLYGPLEGLAPIHIIGGEREVLRQDSLDLQERAASMGIEVTYSMYPGMWHCFFTTLEMPEAQQAYEEIVSYIQQETRES